MQPSYQRPSPRTASSANSLQTNPTRTNNQRHEDSSYSDADSYSEKGLDEGEGDMATTDQRNHQKVNQVIQVCAALQHRYESFVDAPQNFFTKAALTIISSRTILPPSFTNIGAVRQNKWVGLCHTADG